MSRAPLLHVFANLIKTYIILWVIFLYENNYSAFIRYFCYCSLINFLYLMLFARLREAYMNFTLSIKKIIYTLLVPVSQWAEPMLKRKFLHINPETTNIQSVKVIISNENKRVSCYHGSPNGRGGYQISINKSINTVNEQCMTIWSREGWGWYPDDVTLSDTGNSYKSGVQLPFGQIQIKSALPFGERGD